MKVLIVGLGSIAKKHIAALKKIRPDVQIYALRSGTSSSSYNDVINLYSPEEACRHQFDFIIISNLTSMHFEFIKSLKDFNVPLFIEKPLFDSVGSDQDVLVEQISHSLITYVACNLRFLECLQQIKILLVGKRINEVNVYCGSYLPEWRPGQSFRDTYSASKNEGGGVHIDLIHELDYLYWIFGKPVRTAGTFSNRSSLDIDATDYANYIWTYSGFIANCILNYFRRDAKRSFEIVCENETYIADLLRNEIYLDGKLIFSSDQKIVDTYQAQLKYFIDEIIGKGIRFNTIDESYTLLKLCLNG